jgi:hypothetical protein
LASSATLKIKKKSRVPLKEERLKVEIKDDSLKVDAIRKLNQFNEEFIEV